MIKEQEWKPALLDATKAENGCGTIQLVSRLQESSIVALKVWVAKKCKRNLLAQRPV